MLLQVIIFNSFELIINLDELVYIVTYVNLLKWLVYTIDSRLSWNLPVPVLPGEAGNG